MSNIELNSFLTKFHQLKNAGFTAHLDLHAHHGECWVGLRAQLGQAGQQPPHHRHQQQRPGLRRSPAYARRQERRQAARQQAAAAVPASEDLAAEARANEENEDNTVTEKVAAKTAENVVEKPSESPTPSEETPPPPEKVIALIDNRDARIMPRDSPGPKWWCDILNGNTKIHGNTKLILSKELQESLYYSEEVMTHSLFIRNLWISMRQLPLNFECFDPAGSAMMTAVFGTDIVKWTSLCDFLAPHLYFHSSRIGVFNGKKLEA